MSESSTVVFLMDYPSSHVVHCPFLRPADDVSSTDFLPLQVRDLIFLFLAIRRAVSDRRLWIPLVKADSWPPASPLYYMFGCGAL